METPEEADAAVTTLNNTDLLGKVLTVAKVRGRSTVSSFIAYFLNLRLKEAEPALRHLEGITAPQNAGLVRLFFDLQCNVHVADIV